MVAGACQPTQHEGAPMPVPQSCPACGEPCHVPDEVRGRLYTCAACGVEFLSRATDGTSSDPAPSPSDSGQQTRVVQWTETEVAAATEPASGTRLSSPPDSNP